MKTLSTQRVLFAVTAPLLLGVGLLPGGSVQAEEREFEQSFLKRVVAQTTRSGLSIRATRDMRAGTVSGKHEGWMRVETMLSPTGRFEWTVLDEGGSDRTKEKVFLAVLETEAESSREGDKDAAALTPANYTFAPLSSASSGEVRIRLIPKRADKRLVDGILTVSADGYPVRLEGKLAKAPSFWVKSVRVVKEYHRFAGVALPVSLESTADVRFIGKSTFTMRYAYSEVNGRRFAANLVANLSR
jgi:hypothetical protein